MRKTQGFFKIIVTNDDEMKILGMRAVGEHASTAIQAVGLLIKMNSGVEVLAEVVQLHSSIAYCLPLVKTEFSGQISLQLSQKIHVLFISSFSNIMVLYPKFGGLILCE